MRKDKRRPKDLAKSHDQHSFRNLKILSALGWLNRSFMKHTFLYTVLICIVYLIVFQTNILTSGDNWGEAFYEYVHGAIADNMQGFFKLGIAGYFNFLPKLFSYPYVTTGMPLQYIDYYFRVVVVVYAVSCVGFIGHKYNRHLIRNDYLRCLLALMTLMTLYHVSSLSFINVWYIGFIPIILVSLHPQRFTHEWQAVLYAAFAMTVCLSKPSLILLPVVLFRMIRLKEYLLGSILLFAIGLQSALFFTSSYYDTIQPYAVHSSLFSIVGNTALYIGLLFLKLFQFSPFGIISVLFGSIIVFSALLCLIRIRGLMQAAALCSLALLAAYTSIYAPDTPVVSLEMSYLNSYYDQMKLQREVIVYFIIILAVFLLANYVFEKLKSADKTSIRSLALVPLLFIALLAISEYRPINTSTSDVYINIDPFRKSLQARENICMPIPPTPSWAPYGFKQGPTYGWYFETNDYGSCLKTNYDKSIDYTSFTRKLLQGTDISLGVDFKIHGKDKQTIKSILLPISVPSAETEKTLILKNVDTGTAYRAEINGSLNKNSLVFVAFNLSGEKSQKIYRYKLVEDANTSSNIRLGRFTDDSLANFAFFVVN